MKSRPPWLFPGVAAAGVPLVGALWVGLRFGWFHLALGALFVSLCLQPVAAARTLVFAVPTSRPWLLPFLAAAAGLAAAAADIAGPLARAGSAPPLVESVGGLDYEVARDGFTLSFLYSTGLMDIECWTYHAPEGTWTYWRD